MTPLIQNFNVTVRVLTPIEPDAASALAHALGIGLATGIREHIPRWRRIQETLGAEAPLVGNVNVELQLK